MSDFVRGRCFTNIDDFRGVDWPDSFVQVPRVGERVEGKRREFLPTLRVVAVTHCIGEDGSPCVRIELHR